MTVPRFPPRRRALRLGLYFGAHLALPTGAALALSPALAAGPTHGTHGMALFGGREGLYASHLPLFHAPHDYQVLLKIRLADPKADSELRARLDGRTALWTIDPDKFELDRLAPGSPAPLHRFGARLVEGHFERDGQMRYDGVTVVVEQVLLFRRLSPQTAESASARYLQVGEGRQRFLVKTIDSRPDFDHIVAYRAAPGADTASASVAKVALKQPSARALAAALGVPPAAIGGTVYFETADLR